MSCSNFPVVYIVPTGRRLQTQIKEHMNDVKKVQPQSAFSAHVEATGSSFDEEQGMVLLCQEEKGRRLTALEFF